MGREYPKHLPIFSIGAPRSSKDAEQSESTPAINPHSGPPGGPDAVWPALDPGETIMAHVRNRACRETFLTGKRGDQLLVTLLLTDVVGDGIGREGDSISCLKLFIA